MCKAIGLYEGEEGWWGYEPSNEEEDFVWELEKFHYGICVAGRVGWVPVGVVGVLVGCRGRSLKLNRINRQGWSAKTLPKIGKSMEREEEVLSLDFVFYLLCSHWQNL